jgi:hypothetical protein
MSMSDMVVLGAWHRLFQACAIFTILRVVKVIQAPSIIATVPGWRMTPCLIFISRPLAE